LSQKAYFCKDKFILQSVILAEFKFFDIKKIWTDSWKKYLAKIGFSNFKVSHLDYKSDPPSNQILKGVITLAFFDLRTSRGPQMLLKSIT
jgi:hypothetical protein